jgi:hypothetical protein
MSKHLLSRDKKDAIFVERNFLIRKSSRSKENAKTALLRIQHLCSLQGFCATVASREVKMMCIELKMIKSHLIT